MIVFVYFILPSLLYCEHDLSLGVTWVGESSMAVQVTEGMMEVFNDLVPDLYVEIKPQLLSEKDLASTLKEFSLEKNAMVVLRSSGARYLVNYPQPIPTFIGAANNPVQLGVAQNLERPGGNISGVTYQVDYFSVLTLFKQIYPSMKKVLLIYENNHPGSIIDRYNTEQACINLSLSYSDYGCLTLEDILNVIESYRDKNVTFIFPNQALFSKYADNIAKATAGTISFSYNKDLVRSGLLASVSADNYKLGRILAGSVISILYEGKRIGDLPIISDNDPQIAINITTAESLDFVIPMHLLNVAEVYK